MSILSNLFDRLRNHGKTAPAGTTTTASNNPQTQGTPSQQAPSQTTTAQATPQQPGSQPQAAPQSQAPKQPAVASLSDVDMERVFEDLASKSPQKLNWRTSIVDLMKLLGMDSSLQERKELADELGYKGDKNDSAAMNIWLHEQVMRKVAENGGKVPADLMH